MTAKATAPAAPSQGNTSFAQRRAARLDREAEQGPAPRRRTALRAGPDTESDFTMDYITDDGTSQT